MLVKTLQQTHPSYDGDELERLEALYTGGACWRDLLSEWIPQHPQEDDDAWQLRKDAALYECHVGPIVDMIVGALFTQPPVVEDVPGSWFEAFSESVDRKGTGLDVWFAEFVRDALVARRAYVWVNLPARGDVPAPDNRADEEKLGLLDQFLVGLCARQVIDWGTDEIGRLTWVMVRDQYSERASVEVERVTKWRWTYIDATVIRRWEWTPRADQPEPSPEDTVEESPAVLHGLGFMPVADLCLPAGLHAGGKLHDPAIAHLRGRNDLSWALARGSMPLLWVRDRKGEGQKPTLGIGRFLRLYDEASEVGYAEPSGASFKLLADDLTQRREAMYRVVHQMAVGADSSATRSKMSGDSKAQDWKALETVLVALADVVKPLIGRVVAMVVKARDGVDIVPNVTGLDGWEEEDLTTWLGNAALALDASRLSETFRKAVAKREARAILPDADETLIAKIESEIDAADDSIDPLAGVLPAPNRPTPPNSSGGAGAAGGGAGP